MVVVIHFPRSSSTFGSEEDWSCHSASKLDFSNLSLALLAMILALRTTALKPFLTELPADRTCGRNVRKMERGETG